MSNNLLAVCRARWARMLDGWRRLAPRERQMLGGGALVLGSLMFWLLLIEPALKKIDYWQIETPKLRSQAQALELLLQEAGANAQPPGGPGLEQALRQNLDAFGLDTHYQLQAVAGANGRGWQLTFEQAPADAVLDWLLGGPQHFSLHVIEVHLQRAGEAQTEDSAGIVSGTVRMDQALGAKEAS